MPNLHKNIFKNIKKTLKIFVTSNINNMGSFFHPYFLFPCHSFYYLLLHKKMLCCHIHIWQQREKIKKHYLFSALA